MTTLVTAQRKALQSGFRPARIYVGAWGLMYDAAQQVWRDPEGFVDAVERRGYRLEQTINARLGQIGYDLGSLTGALTQRLPGYLRRLRDQAARTGRQAEYELERQVERTLERMGIPTRERIEKLTHEIEALSAKIDQELARYVESDV